MKLFSSFGNLIITIILLLAFSSCEREVSVTPPDVPPPDGFLQIDSYPDSARIFLNNRDRLRSTPDSLRFLETGPYDILLKKEYFNDTSFTVDVVEGERREIFVDYSKNPRMYGSLTLTSKPEGAEIFLNDSNTTYKTPYTFSSIFPGRYKVTYKYKDHLDNNFTTIVRSNKPTEVKKTMVDTTVWSSYTVENSPIPSNKLTTIIIDDIGLIWIGSKDGLIRYDKVSWQLLTSDNSELLDNNINAIAIDSDKIKWIATDNHIGLGDYNTVYANIVSNGLGAKYGATGLHTSTYYDVAILPAGESDFYYFASNIGVARYQTMLPPHWEMFNSVADITSVIVSKYGVMFGTKNAGVGFGKSVYNTTSVNIPSNKVSSLAEANEGVWFGHLSDVGRAGGLSLYNGNTFQAYRFPGNNISVNTIYVDSHNNKWIGADNSIYKFVNFEDKILIDYEYSGLPIENVTGFVEDDSGNIWITTNGNGLFIFKDGINR